MIELSWFPGGHNPRVLLHLGAPESQDATGVKSDDGTPLAGPGPSGIEYSYAPEDLWSARYLAIVREAMGELNPMRSCQIGINTETAEVICRQIGEFAGDLLSGATPVTERAVQALLAAKVAGWTLGPR
jgi:hypothetical protein